MVKHGVSHALGTLTCMLAAQVVSNSVYRALPFLEGIRHKLMFFLEANGWPGSELLSPERLVLVGLMFFWGVLFFALNSGTAKRDGR